MRRSLLLACALSAAAFVGGPTATVAQVSAPSSAPVCPYGATISVSPANIRLGESAELQFAAYNLPGATVTINPGGIVVQNLSVLSVTPTATTDYRLTFSMPGCVTFTTNPLQVTVVAPSSAPSSATNPADQCALSISPASVPLADIEAGTGSFTLDWWREDEAIACTLTQLSGQPMETFTIPVTGDTGSFTVRPRRYSTYRLACGPCQKNVAATVTTAASSVPSSTINPSSILPWEWRSRTPQSSAPLSDISLDPPCGDTPEEIEANRRKGIKCLREDTEPDQPFAGVVGEKLGMEKISTYLLSVVGGLAVLFIVVGGIRYITAGDDLDKLAKAKRTIMYAVVGLVVALLAYVIVVQLLKLATSAGAP